MGLVIGAQVMGVLGGLVSREFVREDLYKRMGGEGGSAYIEP